MFYPLAELVDRLTIEARKRAYGAENAGLLEILESALAGRISCVPQDRLLRVAVELAVANADIANLEWQIREGKHLPLDEVGRRALKIRQINDRRVAAKQEIARLAGEHPESRAYGYGQGFCAQNLMLDVQESRK